MVSQAENSFIKSGSEIITLIKPGKEAIGTGKYREAGKGKEDAGSAGRKPGNARQAKQ